MKAVGSIYRIFSSYGQSPKTLMFKPMSVRISFADSKPNKQKKKEKTNKHKNKKKTKTAKEQE